MKITHSIRTLAGVLGLAALLASAAAQAADPADAYREAKPSIDGIGKFYMGREIAHVMGWQAAAWLERNEREQEERTDLLVSELALKPGMVVADIGAGTGHIARRMAGRVGSGGKVYAVDVQPQMISMIDKLRGGLTQIQSVLSSKTDVTLPAGSVDLAIMVDVYHELEFPREVLASIVKALKPGGRVVFVEYRTEDAKVPIKALHKMSEAQVRLEAGRQALAWERTANVLPWQHMIVFRKK
jgi:ubiquinone/menaquinone biosynthesis C-methylase UbiE